MPVTVRSSGTYTASDELTELVALAARVISKICDECALPSADVELVITDKFQAETDQAIKEYYADGNEGPEFSTERIGGTVAAKNISLTEDGSQVRIVVDASMAPMNSVSAQAQTASLILHELWHPILTRVRHISGSLEGEPRRSSNAEEFARSISRAVIDEYRADRLASIIFSELVTSEEDGQRRGLHVSEVTGASFRNTIGDILDSRVHPRWPDSVERYRDWEVPLDEMWFGLVADTDQICVLLAHAQAECDDLELPGPLADHEDHPGVQLYLGPVWHAVIDVIHSLPLVPIVADFREQEINLREVMQAELLQMWQRLGIRSESQADGRSHLHVQDPLR